MTINFHSGEISPDSSEIQSVINSVVIITEMINIPVFVDEFYPSII